MRQTFGLQGQAIWYVISIWKEQKKKKDVYLFFFELQTVQEKPKEFGELIFGELDTPSLWKSICEAEELAIFLTHKYAHREEKSTAAKLWIYVCLALPYAIWWIQ